MDNNNENQEKLMQILREETESILFKIFESIQLLDNENVDISLLKNLYSDFHSLKGAMSIVGFQNISVLIHDIESVIDSIINKKITPQKELISLIINSSERVQKYVNDSVLNNREIIDKDFNLLRENLKEISDLKKNDNSSNETLVKHIPDYKLNGNISYCLGLIDSIVPEKVYTDTLILKNEILKIYNVIKNTCEYDLKIKVENIILKLEFVSNGTNTFTVNEIEDLKDEFLQIASILVPKTQQGTLREVNHVLIELSKNYLVAEDIKSFLGKKKNEIINKDCAKIIDLLLEILDEIIEKSILLEPEMIAILQNAIAICDSDKEELDSYLVIKQLNILKQLFELNYQKVSDISLSSQTLSNVSVNKISDITSISVDSAKIDLLLSQLRELILYKAKIDKNIEIINEKKLKKEFIISNLEHKFLKFRSDNNYYSKEIIDLINSSNKELESSVELLDSIQRTLLEDSTKLELLIDSIEANIKNIRVMPIKQVFMPLKNLVLNTAKEKCKEIDFEINTNNLSVDKKIIEDIRSPLVHILRNAIDHGIETPEERVKLNKIPKGRIIISSKQENNKIIIEILDDGRGVDVQKIKRIAIDKGFLTDEELSKMSDSEIINLIFWPGFSTSDNVDTVSGRGIGMDIVKTKIGQLNGVVNIISEYGIGSCVRIEIPVTLTTTKVFVFSCAGQKFAVSIQDIESLVHENKSNFKSNNNGLSILNKGVLIPIYYMSEILGFPLEDNEKETVLIVNNNNKKLGFVIGNVVELIEVVQKTLPPPLDRVKNISGIATLSTGESCLILNINALKDFELNNIISPKALVENYNNQSNLPKRILCIEDDLVTQTFLENLLTTNGYIVDRATSKGEALELLAKHQYVLISTDMIIMDITIENLKNDNIIKAIKSQKEYANIPIVVFSSINEDIFYSLDECYLVEKFISKLNFKEEDYIATINNIINIES